MNDELFESNFAKRADFVKKQYSIDDDLFDLLLGCSKIYKADLSDLFNVCVAAYTVQKPLFLYAKTCRFPSVSHTFLLSKQNSAKLVRMRERYGISLSLLINSALAFSLKGKEAGKYIHFDGPERD